MNNLKKAFTILKGCLYVIVQLLFWTVVLTLFGIATIVDTVINKLKVKEI